MIVIFLSKPGLYPKSGLFSLGHLFLFLLTIFIIIYSLKKTIHFSHNKINRLIKQITIFLGLLELVRILFNIYIGNLYNINEYFPLYFCNGFLFSGFLSSWSYGTYKKIGDTYLATGSIIGGIIFLLLPVTSLPQYPTFHFLSIQSFIYHGAMIYVGLLVNFTSYINIKFKDIIYFSTIVGTISIFALITNIILDSNLMFISKDFPGTPISYLYNSLKILFTPIMIIAQMTLPFLVVYSTIYFIKIFNKKTINHKIQPTNI